MLENFNLRVFSEIVGKEIVLFLMNDSVFRKLALKEIQKYSRRILVNLAAQLASDVKRDNYKEWGKPGIRAQLLNTKKNKLEMDFIFEGDKDSFHVLNAVSPAFTCAMPFCEYLFEEIETLRNS